MAFIGSVLIRYILYNSENKIVNIDRLNYASNLQTVNQYNSNPQYIFEHIYISNTSSLKIIFEKHKPYIMMHLVAETHVAR